MHDKYIIPLIIFGTLLLMMLVFIIATFMIINQQRRKRHELEKNEITHLHRNALLQTRLEVEELALKSISREIHDHVNQLLGIVRMNLYHAPQARTVEETHFYVNEANQMVKEVIDHLRDMSHTLSGSGIVKIGLIDAIKKEARNVSLHKAGIDCQVECEEEKLPVSPEQEILIFRIVQEALSNVLKHSQATEVLIRITCDEQLVITVKDNGTGLSPGPGTDGLGLINMHERAAMLRADLEVVFNPGNGCSVRLAVILKNGQFK